MRKVAFFLLLHSFSAAAALAQSNRRRVPANLTPTMSTSPPAGPTSPENRPSGSVNHRYCYLGREPTCKAWPRSSLPPLPATTRYADRERCPFNNLRPAAGLPRSVALLPPGPCRPAAILSAHTRAWLAAKQRSGRLRERGRRDTSVAVGGRPPPPAHPSPSTPFPSHDTRLQATAPRRTSRGRYSPSSVPPPAASARLQNSVANFSIRRPHQHHLRQV